MVNGEGNKKMKKTNMRYLDFGVIFSFLSSFYKLTNYNRAMDDINKIPKPNVV